MIAVWTLIGVLAILLGVALAGFGALGVFAAGMASRDASKEERSGCRFGVAGLVLIAFGIWRVLQ